jgi:hypothetical protein
MLLPDSAIKFRELYNSVSYNSDDMQGIIDNISDKLTNSQVNEDYIVTSQDVKRHKGDGCSDLTSDHFICAGDDCLIHV